MRGRIKKDRGYDASAIFHYKKPFLSWIKQLEGKEEELDVSEGGLLSPPPTTPIDPGFIPRFREWVLGTALPQLHIEDSRVEGLFFLLPPGI